jgi:hypothetical protein
VLKGSMLASGIKLRRRAIVIPSNELVRYKLNTLIASEA